MKEIKNIGVIGSGTMGNGIAQTFALFGFQVHLIDLNLEILEKAKNEILRNLERMVKKNAISLGDQEKCLERIQFSVDFQAGLETKDLIVEAVTENPEIKLDLFRKMDGYAPSHCILASNTSSISITRLASVTKRPEKVIGMHFMNPVPIMKLVEVVSGLQTNTETLEQIMSLSRILDKIPVPVKDYPGFISNRILIPMINEAIYSLYEGIAGVEEIDSIMTLGMSHPMGPLFLADFIGLDVCLSILEVLYKGFKNPKYAACPLLVNMVMAGRLGVKSGIGFYIYDNEKKEKKVNPQFLVN